MGPPPSAGTPSSNRFIFKRPTNRPQSGAQQRPVKTERQEEASTSEARQSAVQFAPIPRFSAPKIRSSRASSYPPRSPSPIKSSFPPPGAAPSQKHEDVPDVQDANATATASDEDDDMLDNEINRQPTPSDQLDSATAVQPSSSKRPRLTQDEPLTPQLSAKPTFPRFVIPPSHSQPPGAARFRLPPSPSQVASVTEVSADSNRSAFLKPSLPPPDAAAAAEPLPDAFSPHRKGQRYVPGGMAAEFSSWVIETGQAASLSRRGKGYLRGSDFVRETRIGRVRESHEDHGTMGPVFVEGVDGGGGECRVMLAQRAEEKHGVKVGDVVGIRAPSWDVVVDGVGDGWVVGVDWRIVR
ncbi:hypothetical protein BDV97DRAFT_365938 [Delphinella strobiligena]|nr:hypothetical protein BDV97DRAFT_365938 [Delphinella strobiligena]